MPLHPWESILPEKEQQLLTSSDELAVSQCLADLGYWDGKKRSGLPAALKKFRKDCQQEKLLPAGSLSKAKATLEEEALLKKLVALEGDCPVFQLPAQGTQGLSVRLLHYRLHLLGLYHDPIAAPFSPAGLSALQQLAQWLQLAPDSPKTLALCGDLMALIHRLTKFGQLDQHIVTFRFSSKQLPRDLQKEVREERGVKENPDQLEKTEKTSEKELRQLEDRILGKEKAERQRLVSRNLSKQRKLQRLSRLMRAVHRQQKQLLQSSLKQGQSLEKKISRQSQKIDRQQALLQEMETLLSQHSGSGNKKKTEAIKRADQRAEKKHPGRPTTIKEAAKRPGLIDRPTNERAGAKTKTATGAESKTKRFTSQGQRSALSLQGTIETLFAGWFLPGLESKSFQPEGYRLFKKEKQGPFQSFPDPHHPVAPMDQRLLQRKHR